MPLCYFFVDHAVMLRFMELEPVNDQKKSFLLKRRVRRRLDLYSAFLF